MVLPASSYLEKDGTYTNTDRRVQLGHKVLDPPGQARVDWEIVQDLAQRIGLDWHYSSPREVFDELVGLMPNYAKLSYDNLGGTGKLYPNADPEHSDGTVVLFDERFNTGDGLAHLVPAQWLPAKELPDADYPLVLNTGRLLEHWHTGSMTRRSYGLDAIAPQAEVYVHPKDAADRGLAHGEMVRVRSRRGEIELRLKVSHREAPGTCGKCGSPPVRCPWGTADGHRGHPASQTRDPLHCVPTWGDTEITVLLGGATTGHNNPALASAHIDGG